MRPTTPEVIVENLERCVLMGAVRLSNGMMALVFEGGHLLAINGTAYLMHDEVAATVLESAAKRLRDESAELRTLDTLGGAHADTSIRRQAVVMRDRMTLPNQGGQRRRVESVLGDEVTTPEFLNNGVIGLGRTDVERRAMTEKLSREIPEV